jgi:hypothetical protein
MGRQEVRRGFASPEELNAFLTTVRVHLQTAGFDLAARRIEQIQSTAFTTSSEWLGEIRHAVFEIRFGNRLPADLDAELEQLQDSVV